MPGITLTEEEVRSHLLRQSGCRSFIFIPQGRTAARNGAGRPAPSPSSRMVGATDTLRQLGLWQEERPVHPTPERPQYTEEDLKREQQAGDGRFRNLVGEAQRRLGRTPPQRS